MEDGIGNDEEEDIQLDDSETSGSIDFFDKPNTANTFKAGTCLYFKNYGYCKFGNNCRYNHFRKVYNNAFRYNNHQKVTRSQSANEIQYAENERKVHNSNYQSSKKESCRFFQVGGCKKGETCQFLHSVDSVARNVASLNVSSQSQNVPKKFFSSAEPSKKKTAPLCYFFKRGLCYKGDNCKYYHSNKTNPDHFESVTQLDKENTTSLLSNEKSMTENPSTKSTGVVFSKPSSFHSLSSLTDDIISQLRSTEINQLKKRFPHAETVVEDETISFLFEPSDPDWAFDVNKLTLEVNFPEYYPANKCKITVLRNPEYIPQLLIKHLNQAIAEWIDKKIEENNAANKTELIFRPFLKWFDKNLENLFIGGLRKVKQDLKAKEDGIEFIPAEELFSSSEANHTEMLEKDVSDECIEENENITEFNSLCAQEQTSISANKVLGPKNNNTSTYYCYNDGVKIILTGLEFIEGTAAFICTKFSATLQCSRCKTSFNMKSIPKKSNSCICSKCSKNVGFTFEAATVHQFSNVLGTLHLIDSIPIDVNLIECHFLIDCLNCSKQAPADGIHYGQKHKMWCTFCNSKMLLSIGSVKFQMLRSTSISVAKYPSVKKIEKKVKDPVVKEGEPLPNFGACKHYKKSFRWLRFPCCGRLYPCDECHNENETSHEMKYASRMLCGFCAKEQPYTRDKPCISCSQSVTKKSGCHWEGGKGCRNKIQMGREDKQKYSGISKTISKKAQMSMKPKKKH